MKRINNLFDKICSLENLKLADDKVRKGKSKSKEIILFDLNKDLLLNKLSENLKSLNFKTSEYKTFKLNEYGSFISTSVSMPVQAPTASAPPYIKGGLYF